MLNIVKKRTQLSVVLLFIIVNLIFNFNNWHEIFSPVSNDRIASGDSSMAEFILENNYRNIQNNDPFTIHQKLLYPFDTNLSLNDPGLSNVIFFYIFRPFLDIHKSMLLVVLLNAFLANLCMYFLLRRLHISLPIAALIGLSYGFMPMATSRLLGHYTYTSIYLFPLIYLIFLSYLQAKSFKKKTLMAVFFGSLLAFILLLNFYFFLGIIIGFFLYTFYYLIKSWKLTIKFYVKHTPFIVISLVPFIIILIPWMLSVRQLYILHGVEKTPGFGGAIELSGDLLGFITPSENNPIYRSIIYKLAEYGGIFEKFRKFYFWDVSKFIYPGLFILGTYGFLIIRYKRISKSLKEKIHPHFVVSIIYGILLLGPFLKVANRYFVSLEGIPVVFPMPFLILHYIPGLQSVRAPTRFSTFFIFLALIVVAYVFDKYFLKLTSKKKQIVLLGLFIVFFVDQFYTIPEKPSYAFPVKAYKYIKSDQSESTVLQIPFTIRDGFKYIGYVHAISPTNGTFIHGKPVIGGYFARFNSSVFEYHSNLPFIGYVAKIIDKGNYNPDKEGPKPLNIIPFRNDIKKIDQELEFLSVKFILLKNNEKYSKVIEELIEKVEYKFVLNDGEYDLYSREFQNNPFNEFIWNESPEELQIVEGFTVGKDKKSLLNNKLAFMFLKVPSDEYNRMEIVLESLLGSSELEIYINEKYVKTIQATKGKHIYVLNAQEYIHQGINNIKFRFPKSSQVANKVSVYKVALRK